MTEAAALPPLAGRLPAEVTSFVGRKFERSAVRNLLSESRLVTLTGFGGVGKTRLALKVATELRRAFEDGVCFVPLGALGQGEAVPDEIAGALGLHGRTTDTATGSVVEHLRQRRLLLVLDNCEHVVDAVAVIADAVLQHCPQVRILATSREPLRVDGEVLHAVSPLSCPGPNAGDFQKSEAVQLFLDRAGASAPGFNLSERNRASVAAICTTLEGIPLAIELAAARLTTLSASELERGLTDHWELLSRGRRTAPYRQSTMAACIEWSFDLCTPAERKLWAKASVFVDGFERDAAIAVCSDPGDEPTTDTLASLVEKSVLSTTLDESGARFRMLPPIRQRGLAELQRAFDADEQRRRHRDFFLDLVDQAHAAWLGSDQLDWIDRIRREIGNIAEALNLCAADPDTADAGLRACGELLPFIHVQGLFRQGRRWCDRLLACPSRTSAPRAMALRAACWWATMQGDMDSARAMVEEGRILTRSLGGEAEHLLTQAAGLVALYSGEPQTAGRLLEQAIKGLADSGNAAELAHSWMLLTIACAIGGDPERALSCHREGLAIVEPTGESWIRSWTLWGAGLAYWAHGDSASAQRVMKEALRLEQVMEEPMGICATMEAIAWIIAATDPEQSATLLGSAQNEWDRIEAAVFRLPGLDDLHQDSVNTARRLLGDDAFEHFWSLGRTLDQAGAIAFCLGDRPRGETILQEAASPQLLTARERQIAELIHAGLSNQQIADTLVISRRTVEGHVQHVLDKLGFTNRIQIAVWFGDESHWSESH